MTSKKQCSKRIKELRYCDLTTFVDTSQRSNTCSQNKQNQLFLKSVQKINKVKARIRFFESWLNCMSFTLFDPSPIALWWNSIHNKSLHHCYAKGIVLRFFRPIFATELFRLRTARNAIDTGLLYRNELHTTHSHQALDQALYCLNWDISAHPSVGHY